MRKNRKVFPLVIVITLFINYNMGYSQTGDFLDILYAAPEDASRYADGYFSPIFKGLGYGFNNGWYQTAKPHQTLGIDLSFSINLAYVPEEDLTFSFENSDYEVFQLASGTQADVPTAFGSDNESDLHLFQVTEDQILPPGSQTGQDLVVAEFLSPKGADLEEELGFSAVPSPIIQLGIGIVKNTDLKIRYVPDVVSKDVDYSIWGIGILHDVGQWIPVINQAPLDLSVFGAYSSMSADIFFEPQPNFPGADQSISTSIKGYTVEALISKKISLLTLYGGLGYNSAKTNFDLLGTYNVTYSNPGLPQAYTITYEDPIHLDTNEGSVRATGGLRLQFAVFTLHGQYTFNGYNILNFGFGFTFR